MSFNPLCPAEEPFERILIFSKGVYKRNKPDKKWGRQRTHSNFVWNTILMEEIGEASEAIFETSFGQRSEGYTDVDVRRELVQAGAVIVQWITAIDGRGVGEKE